MRIRESVILRIRPQFGLISHSQLVKDASANMTRLMGIQDFETGNRGEDR
jgi:hypothetical protein